MKVEFYISAKETKLVKKLITKASGVNKGLGTLHTIAVFFSSLFIGFSLMQIIPYTMRVYVVFPVYIVCLGVLVFGIFIYFVSRWYVGKKIIEKTGLQKAKITYEILPNKIIRLTDDGLK
jgi:phosphotransferase system  glucose/maltose/N-acetylglucosamine-specific IIC component